MQEDKLKFVEALVSKMTLEEKVGQMNQYTGFRDHTGPVTRGVDPEAKLEHIRQGKVGSMLNVKGVEEIRELQCAAVEGSRLGIPMIFGFDVIHGYKTLTPIPLAEAASFDLKAIENSARIAAREAAAAGINWTFAPMVDVSRDARWGRVMEGAGEDPWYGSQVARARIRGFQGDDLSDPLTVAACAKHFAAYGFAESGKDYNTVDMSQSTLHNVVLPPFKAAVDAGVATFMNGFNELNGIPVTADKHIQRDILKGHWAFDGFMVSDWNSVGELPTHGLAADLNQATRLAVEAGCDMDMESHAYIRNLTALVEDGEISEETIDDAVSRILGVKYDLGLFEDPYRYCDQERESALIECKAHKDAALDIARKSIVLLKNDDQLLPLTKSGLSIGLIGPLGTDKTSPLGSWRLGSEDESADSVLEGLSAIGDNTIEYESGVTLVNGEAKFTQELSINTDDRRGIERAVALAQRVDRVVMVLGEHAFQSGEGRSRTNLGLPGLQQELLEQVYAVNQNVILVLMNGRPLTISWAAEHVPAIVETWHLGTRSGDAIAQVLYGDFNPSGKLPMTFPRSVGQVPIYYNTKNTGRPIPLEPVFWSHYSDESNEPLYPFGFGLSYASFEYLDLRISLLDNAVSVVVDIKNTSQTSGTEVVQVYIRDRVASVTRPVKELKRFAKVFIEQDNTTTVQFELTTDDLGFYDNQGQYIFEPGEFEIMVGGNSRDLLKETVVVDL